LIITSLLHCHLGESLQINQGHVQESSSISLTQLLRLVAQVLEDMYTAEESILKLSEPASSTLESLFVLRKSTYLHLLQLSVS